MYQQIITILCAHCRGFIGDDFIRDFDAQPFCRRCYEFQLHRIAARSGKSVAQLRANIMLAMNNEARRLLSVEGIA